MVSALAPALGGGRLVAEKISYLCHLVKRRGTSAVVEVEIVVEAQH